MDRPRAAPGLYPNDHPSRLAARHARTPSRPRRGPTPVAHHQLPAPSHPPGGVAHCPREPAPEPSRKGRREVPPYGKGVPPSPKHFSRTRRSTSRRRLRLIRPLANPSRACTNAHAPATSGRSRAAACMPRRDIGGQAAEAAFLPRSGLRGRAREKTPRSGTFDPAPSAARRRHTQSTPARAEGRAPGRAHHLREGCRSAAPGSCARVREMWRTLQNRAAGPYHLQANGAPPLRETSPGPSRSSPPEMLLVLPTPEAHCVAVWRGTAHRA